VTLGGATLLATVDANGLWETTFPTETLARGEYEAEVSVSSTDAAGNVNTVTAMVRVDTETSVTISDTPVTGDDLVDGAEAAQAITLTGTAEAGASVIVAVEGTEYTADVAADGAWSLTLPAGALPGGEYTATATVTATDAAGNVASASRSFDVDTETFVTIDTGLAGGDDLVNAAELAAGVTLTGTAEPGSSVTVSVDGVALPATLDAAGNWSVQVSSADLAPGERTATLSVTATDPAGNSATTTGTLDIDTQTFVEISDAPITDDDVVNAAERAASGVTLTGTTEAGASVIVTMAGTARPAQVDVHGNWTVTFLPGEVPTGETVAPVSVEATDAAGNRSTTTGEVTIDTLVRDFALTSTPGGADGVLNAVEAEAGLTVTGTTEPGARVMVQMGQANLPAQVDTDGSWTVTIPQNQITRGEYTTTMTVTSTDAAGNVDTLTQAVEVDTEAGILTLSRAPIEGDNVINHEESLDGVVIRGTSDPGAVVQVSLGGVTHSTVTDAAGNWQRLFTRAEIPADTADAPIVATTTDAAGNTRTVTGSVGVDTVVENFGFAPETIGGDGVINGVEQQGVVEVTGTVEPGSTVNVMIGGVTRTAQVQADGTWSAGFLHGSLPTGEETLPVLVTAIDRHGNRAELRDTVELDTLVNRLTSTGDPTGGDGVVNLAEAQAGLSLNGQVEAGSTVLVTVAGMAYQADVTPSGDWSIDLPGNAIPAGLTSIDVSIDATDPAGNTSNLTQALALDLEAPETPVIVDYTRNLNGFAAISVDLTSDDISVYEVNQGTPGGQVGGDGVPVDVFGIEAFRFTPEIPDGSHLIVHSVDAAGNSSGTYLVLDELTNARVDLSNTGLGAFNIEAVDLQFAEDSHLTITEAQIIALSSNTDTLVVAGGADDTVTITGASNTGETRVIEGQTYQVYSLGDATVVVDEDINTVI